MLAGSLAGVLVGKLAGKSIESFAGSLAGRLADGYIDWAYWMEPQWLQPSRLGLVYQ